MQSYTIFISGARQAGKTSFIDSITEKDVVSTDRRIRLTKEEEQAQQEEQDFRDKIGVQLDFGRLILDDDHVIYLFNVLSNYLPELPLEWIMKGSNYWQEQYPQKCIGHVLLVDSAYVPHFFIARNLIEAYEETNVPYIVACNKQDLADAWSPKDLKIALEIPDDVPVLPCIATDRNSVRDTLIHLCEEVLRCEPYKS